MNNEGFPKPSRLTLGTVQLGMPYGRIAETRPPTRSTVLSMLDVAIASGIACIDTAAAYGDAEAVIGDWLEERGEQRKASRPAIVTKLAVLPGVSGSDLAGAVLRSAAQSRTRLKLDQLEGYLVHRTADLHRPGVVEAMRELVDSATIGTFGVSVYEPRELEAAIHVPDLSLIQLPLSVFDRRIARSGLIVSCAERGITVFARSVFLQGLAFLDPAQFPAHFEPLRPRLAELHRLAEQAEVSVAAICLQSVIKEPGIASTVIGAATLEQLAQTLAAADQTVPPETLDEARALGEGLGADILDPRRWP